MKLTKIGKHNLFYTKKDGTAKKTLATPEVIAYANNNLKVGDSLKCEFSSDYKTIVKVSKYTQETSKGKYNGYKGGYSAPSDERSVYATVGTIVAGMKLTDLEKVKEAVRELFAQGMELIKAKETEKPKEEEETLTSTEEEPDED